ncbi:MAG: sialate O-acetylesterase [Oscillospiraceae bacterium]|jgi:hypothetical protein|nr:sialate O-acetylesterase [Oscillospiraceae bacterium]
MLKDFSKEKFDIIIQGGQSNSDGTGHGYVSNPYYPDGRVWHLNQDFTISIAQERVIGNQIRSDLSLEFARRYIGDDLLAKDRKLLIIRAAVGGTGFSDNRWGLKDDLYLQMIEMIKTAINLNNENKLVAFLWHQGETDAGNGVDFDTHYKNLSTLVQTVRDEFKQSNLPFIAGDFVQQWKQNNIEICTPIIEAIRAVCELVRYSAFVETNGLKSNFEEYGAEADGNEDEIHFSRAAIYELGDRYYSAYRGIV